MKYQRTRNGKRTLKKLNLTLVFISLVLFLTLSSFATSQTTKLTTKLSSTIELEASVNTTLNLTSSYPFEGTISLLSDASMQLTPSIIQFSQGNFTYNTSIILNITYNETNTTNNATNIIQITQIQITNYTALFSYNLIPHSVGSYEIAFNLSNLTQTLDMYEIVINVVDTSAPGIVSTSVNPTSAPNNPVEITLNTTENATCKYSEFNSTYENMTDGFSITGSKFHSKTLTGLVGSYTFYARCIDGYGNKMSYPAIFSFTVSDYFPTAKIVLSDPTPIKAGTIDITLIASENLQPTPTLEYEFTNSPGTYYQIPLAGSNNVWTGYMTISPSDDGKIGSFRFNGKDLSGNNGSYITEGKLFVIDNTKPISPLNIGATRLSNGDIILEWYYDGEPIDYFKIYRKTVGGVDYLDSFATSKSQTYTDTTTYKNTTYYYRVSAVDKAGNNGFLSAEVALQPIVDNDVTISNIIEQQQLQQDSLLKAQKEELEALQTSQQNPTLVQKESDSETLSKNLLRDIRTLSVELDWAINNLARNDDPQAQKIIDVSNLLLQSNQARSTIADIEENIQEIRKSPLPEEEKINKLKDHELSLKKIRKTSPKNARIIGKSEFVQVLKETDTDEVSKLFFGGSNSGQIKDYQKAVSKFQTNVEVLVIVTQVLVENIDKSYSNKTFIRKEISYKSPDTISNVYLTEIIPKTIAQVADDINIKTANSQILESDPIIQWGIAQFNYEKNIIEYSVDKYLDRTNAEELKTVVLLDKSNYYSALPPTLAGNVIKSMDSGGFGSIWRILLWLGFITFTLLLAYYVIYVKGAEIKGTQILTKEKDEKGVQHFNYASQLLLEAKQALDKGNIDRAKILYDEISGIYKYLPENAKSILHPKCISLHSKIQKAIKKNE